jgi:folylpolyglutamate synthase/dihydropteroate synthase
MRHDSTREIAAAVREATAPLEARIRALVIMLDDQFGTPCEQIRHAEHLAERDATIMELRDHLSQANEAHKSEVWHLEKVRETLEMAIVILGEERDAANAALAEMTRCTTAGRLQEAKERQADVTRRIQEAADAGSMYVDLRPRPTCHRTDDDGPMWRPEETGT